MKMMLLSVLGVLHVLCAPAFSLTQPSGDYWGDYGPFGPCSRTCGTGVAMRTRTCITQRTDGGYNCVGSGKSFRLCNTQPCPPGSRDFREEQCAQFDRRHFQSKQYSWSPYYGGSNPCELVCAPRGENFFYRHRHTVVDGTPCYAGRPEICVEGVCRTVSHGEILGLDQATSSIPSSRHSPAPAASVRQTYRYTYGAFSACSVTCGGGRQTRRVQCVTDSPSAPQVVDDSYCIAQGLLRPAIQQACNYQACAEYSVSGFSACSVTCGEGVQRREVFCASSRAERLLEHACSGLTRPQETQPCRKPACQVVLGYHTSDWSLCSQSCNTGRRDRRVACMDQDGNQYGEDRCASQFKPPSVESCNTQPCPGTQRVPSVQNPGNYQSTLRGFMPYDGREFTAHRTQTRVPDTQTNAAVAHCGQSYYGCCPDGRTSAVGPRGEGCPQDCVRTRFGCCLDGVTTAQGYGGAGCPAYPSRDRYPAQSPSASVCYLPRDVGPCYSWTSRFYYNSSTGSCTHFWYGGCQGNGNNFVSVEKCRQVCGGIPSGSTPRRGSTRVRDPTARSYARA